MRYVEKAVATSIMLTFFVGSVEGAEYFTETWDNGSTEMWFASIGLDATAPLAGGNPGGFLEVFGNLPGSGIGQIATSKPEFTGSFIDAAVTRFGVDLILTEATDNIDLFLRVRVDGADNGWRLSLTNTAMLDMSWQSFVVDFDPSWSDGQALAAGWIDESAFSFSMVMDSVGQFGLQFRGASDDRLFLGLDNLTIVPGPSSAIACLGVVLCRLRRRRRR